MTNETIGTKIHRKLLEKNWTQSDLCRALWPGETIIDSRGYSAPRGRDRASAWIADKQVPSLSMLRRISEVLGIPLDELQPNAMASRQEKNEPSMSINVLAGAPDRCLLKINKLLPLKTALAIAELVEQAEAK